MKTTHTYLNSTYFSPVKLATLQGFQPELGGGEQDMDYAVPHSGIGGFISAIWFWLRACVYVVTGYGDPYASDDIEFVERPYAYGRERRHLDKWAARVRAKHGYVPASRSSYIYRDLGWRDLSPTQFLERRCRLSGWSRVKVYDMRFQDHLCAREALVSLFTRGEFRVPHGLCEAHLWPD